jgi:tetratricopeptide (TPR) repeat protein
LGKILWPTHLIFVYPRWHVSQAVGWQYLYPVTLILALTALWRLRRRWRGPLAGVLFFIVTLSPLLGFVDAYLFVYTYVADHFQYLAMLGIITLAAAGIALSLDRWGLWRRPGGYAICFALLTTLAGLTWRQCPMYSDNETLYRAVVAENPDCWMGHMWVGILAARRAHTDEAIAQFEEALRIKPDCAGAHNNLGLVLAGLGQTDEAIAHYRKALELNPNFADPHNNIGGILAGRGQLDEAIAEFRKELEINSNNAEARRNLDLIRSQREKNANAPAAHPGSTKP